MTNRTLLLVDDDPLVLRVLCRVLRRPGWRLLTAGSARAAEDVLRANLDSIELLLTDVVLPDADGGALGRWALALNPALHVLYMSGYGPSILRKHDVAAGIERFVGKPFDATEVRRQIAAAFGTGGEV